MRSIRLVTTYCSSDRARSKLYILMPDPSRCSDCFANHCSSRSSPISLTSSTSFFRCIRHQSCLARRVEPSSFRSVIHFAASKVFMRITPGHIITAWLSTLFMYHLVYVWNPFRCDVKRNIQQKPLDARMHADVAKLRCCLMHLIWRLISYKECS